MSRRIPSKAKYLVELNGVSQLRASKVTGPGLEHEPGTNYQGNKNTPDIVPGNWKPSEVTVTTAYAVDETTYAEVAQWFQGYKNHFDLEPRTMRVITLDPSGAQPISTKEYVGCVPKTLKDDDYDASSNEAAMFTFSVMAENMLTL